VALITSHAAARALSFPLFQPLGCVGHIAVAEYAHHDSPFEHAFVVQRQ
jgi:hypothetical protein